MDLPWGDERTKKFVTNVGLITSNGPYGYDIMAAEWTHHVSYSPGLIAACINRKDATNANIAKSKEFGVSLCASNQNVLSSIAGGSSGKNVNKIEALKELGFKFFKAKKINVLMAEGAAMNAECRLYKKNRAWGPHRICRRSRRALSCEQQRAACLLRPKILESWRKHSKADATGNG